MQLTLVQILVVVATIQVRTLKTEEEQASMSTAFVHGLVGPKAQVNSVNCTLISNNHQIVLIGAKRESG